MVHIVRLHLLVEHFWGHWLSLICLLNEFAVASLQTLLERLLVIVEEEHLEDAEEGEVPTDNCEAAYNSQRGRSCRLKRVVVVGVLEEESESVVAEVSETLLEVGLREGEEESVVQRAPGPETCQGVRHKGRYLCLIKLSKGQLKGSEP